MTEDGKPSPLKDLDARLNAARQHRSGRVRGNSDGKGGTSAATGIGFAFRIGTELVAALIIGVAIGYGLDTWLETKPWFLVLFFLLGAAAGFVNVFRAVSGYGLAAGYTKPDGKNGKTDKSEG